MNSKEPPESNQLRKPKERNDLLLEKGADKAETSSVGSEMSGGANMRFFAPPHQVAHTNSHSWISSSQCIKNEFARIERLVKYMAPEQFRNPARPSFGPCGIVPTTVLEFVEHNADILKLKTTQLEKNHAAKKETARVSNLKANGKTQPPVTSKFGVGAKVYHDGMSPVLMQPTMWSLEYNELQSIQPEWPSQAEFRESGDKCMTNRDGKRRARSLPPPRVLIHMPVWDVANMCMTSLNQGYAIKHLLPFDVPCSEIDYNLPPNSIMIENSRMDNDLGFENQGRHLLGVALMEEIGERQTRFVPDWLAYRRRRPARQQMRANTQMKQPFHYS